MIKSSLDQFSSEDKELLEIISLNNLTHDDIKWLKSKRWFKRFLKVYSKELKKRYKNKPIINEKKEKQNIKINQESIETLDFTKTIDVSNASDIALASDKAKKIVKAEKMIWRSIIIICSFSLIFLSVVLLNWYLENKKMDDMVDRIYEVAEVKEIKKTTNKTEVTTTVANTTLSDYEKYANMSMLNVNLDNLKEINSDTVGWIYVPGTKINYPFVHTTDNDYYL